MSPAAAGELDPLLQQVAERFRARAQGIVKPPSNVLEWAKRYRKIEGQPFTLDNYHPLEAIYTDDWPRLVIKKPAQRGVSEYAVNLACFALEHGHQCWVPEGSAKDGLNVGYIFPIKKALEDFAKERINGLREESPHLAEIFSGDEYDSLGYKKVGRSVLYMRGSYAVSDLLSFPADVIILDEYDRMDAKSASLARRRMNNSVVKREVLISTPTLPGRGISAAYESSDRRVYETQCLACEAWASFDFFSDVKCDGEVYENWKHWSTEHVAVAEVTLHCPACGVAIGDAERCRPGRWRITNPDITRVHGYQVPWWPFRTVDLQSFAIAAVSPEPSEVEEFYRSDLGMPHGSGTGSVTEEMLLQLAAMLPEGLPIGPWANTTLGADIGARIHYRLSSQGPDGLTYVRSMGSVDSWDELDQMMFRYQVRMAVVDAEPEILTAQDFVNRWPGRARRAFYPTSANALRGVLFNLKEVKNGIATDVQVNRTMAMDKVYGLIAAGAERWPAEIVHDTEVVAHMTAPARVKVSDDNGQARYTWVHTTPDHLYHASVYDVIARETLPKAQSYPPAAGGERPILSAYQQTIERASGGVSRAFPGTRYHRPRVASWRRCAA